MGVIVVPGVIVVEGAIVPGSEGTVVMPLPQQADGAA
jgi:hypothetical protein